MLLPGTCLLLAVLVTLDGPFPVVPSEPLLMTALGVAAGDPPAVAALLAAALAGSVVGDALMFVGGRTSRRLPVENRLTGWVSRHVRARPGATLVGARFLPGGRLVSTVAAGRYGVPPGRFALWSLVSSTAWVLWMLALGLLLGPVIAGDPWRGLAAGCLAAALVTALTAVAARAVAVLRNALRPARHDPGAGHGGGQPGDVVGVAGDGDRRVAARAHCDDVCITEELAARPAVVQDRADQLRQPLVGGDDPDLAAGDRPLEHRLDLLSAGSSTAHLREGDRGHPGVRTVPREHLEHGAQRGSAGGAEPVEGGRVEDDPRSHAAPG